MVEKGFDDFCLCSVLMLHAILPPQEHPGPVSGGPWWPSEVFVWINEGQSHICITKKKEGEKKRINPSVICCFERG